MGVAGKNGYYEISYLLLLAIFLWKDSYDVKAKELFEVFDTQVERNLD